jgi:hypothetical protein
VGRLCALLKELTGAEPRKPTQPMQAYSGAPAGDNVPLAFLRKLFTSRLSREEVTDYSALQLVDGGLQSEYEKLVLQQIRRWGVPPSCASVSVREIDTRGNKGVFMAFVRLHGWDRDSALRLLLGLPSLEKKIREHVRAHWVSEISHFDGVWLQAADELQETGPMTELRKVLVASTSATPHGQS